MTMTRRSALAALGLAAGASAPRSATAQDARVQRLGVLSLNHNAPAFEALVDELAKLGYEPSRNLAVDYRINLDVDQLPQLAGELASLNTNVILVHGPEPPLTAVRRFAPTIPTVFVAYNYDPVRRGQVQSLARPGGRVTGVSLQFADVAGKQVELLRQAAPHAARLGILYDTLTTDQFSAAEQAARSAGLGYREMRMDELGHDFERAFSSLATEKAEAVLVLSSPLFSAVRRRVVELALEHRLPAVYTHANWAKAGGLMSYGPDDTEMHRRAAHYIAKVFRGARPEELPVEQPSTFDLTINLRTAKALGLTMPPSLLARADEVIE
jgi:putative tryptophan/tyrosine transport system substrate-binding protein